METLANDYDERNDYSFFFTILSAVRRNRAGRNSLVSGVRFATPFPRLLISPCLARSLNNSRFVTLFLLPFEAARIFANVSQDIAVCCNTTITKSRIALSRVSRYFVTRLVCRRIFEFRRTTSLVQKRYRVVFDRVKNVAIGLDDLARVNVPLSSAGVSYIVRSALTALFIASRTTVCSS